MTYIIRPATVVDLQPVYEMAKSTGGGFTNLPPNRAALTEKLLNAEASFAHDTQQRGDDFFFFILENIETREVHGTCLIFSKIGQTWPFYSYRIGTLTQISKELNRTFKAETLTLSTDFDGASEVGGLYLNPNNRAGGLGMLLARSRYLFIKMHRTRFADRTIAELRGVQDEAGGSPFWDGIAGRFFGMSFQEADAFNAVHGNQFIADLMPKHPIYTAMLPESALSVMGVPHKSGRAALQMLQNEGFVYDHYVDIFDGGPTVSAPTDQIETIKRARADKVVQIGGVEEERADKALVAHGHLIDYRCGYGYVRAQGDGVALDTTAAAALGVQKGDTIMHVARW
ncbi:MAG: arginine N-succinyltransferase [Alphaproteobacteria bacterium]|nr:arginine N-succinyltransferase [Alphaproteobacteria bacterium]MDE2339599.1 arginine N-succinyltransferase [Alphaproteobacteria bacterium]